MYLKIICIVVLLLQQLHTTYRGPPPTLETTALIQAADLQIFSGPSVSPALIWILII